MSDSRFTVSRQTPVPPWLGLPDTLGQFKRLFQGRTDVYAVQQPDGSYRPQRRALSDQVLRSHLTGDITVGMYLVTPVEDTCSFMTIDVDLRSKAMATSLIEAANALGLVEQDYLLESSGNKGFHMWFFFDEKMPAMQAMQFGRLLCEKADLFRQVEIFPKQAHVPTGGFGNLIKLPGRHAKSGRFSRFFSTAFELQDVGWLRQIRRIPAQGTLSVLSTPRAPPIHATEPPKGSCASRSPIPCITKMLARVSEGKRNTAAFRLAIFLKNQGLPQEIASAALEAWNLRNQPAIGPGELYSTIQQVYQKDYRGYGCLDPQM